MTRMRGTVISLPRGSARDQRLARAIETRRALDRRSGGRAWINGREVGGPDGRFAHLAASHD
jgi:hypothetical protein